MLLAGSKALFRQTEPRGCALRGCSEGHRRSVRHLLPCPPLPLPCPGPLRSYPPGPATLPCPSSCPAARACLSRLEPAAAPGRFWSGGIPRALSTACQPGQPPTPSEGTLVSMWVSAFEF